MDELRNNRTQVSLDIRTTSGHLKHISSVSKKRKRYNSITIKGIGTIRFKGTVPDNVKLLRIVQTPLRTKVQLIHEIPDTDIIDNRAPIGIDRGINKLIALSN